MDFNAILQAVMPLAKQKRRPEVAPAIVEGHAARMAKEGYLHSVESLKAVKLCLEGYGVLISGNVGTGKTFLFQTLYAPVPRRMWSTQEICERFTPADVGAWMSQFDNLAFILDDLGAEPVYNNFGSRVEMMSLVIEHRSRLRNAVQTHITTNLTAAQVKERYGDRVLDRINGMCTFIKFKGHSLRNAEPARVS